MEQQKAKNQLDKDSTNFKKAKLVSIENNALNPNDTTSVLNEQDFWEIKDNQENTNNNTYNAQSIVVYDDIFTNSVNNIIYSTNNSKSNKKANKRAIEVISDEVDDSIAKRLETKNNIELQKIKLSQDTLLFEKQKYQDELDMRKSEATEKKAMTELLNATLQLVNNLITKDKK